MLKIVYGEIENCIHDVDTYFYNVYNKKWFEDELIKKMIFDIDKSEVVSGYLIRSKVLGDISPDLLSSGVKTLILLFKDSKKILNASNCGDNCAKWILEIAKIKNITINLYHIMDFGKKDFDVKVKILNNNIFVNNMRELIINSIDYV